MNTSWYYDPFTLALIAAAGVPLIAAVGAPLMLLVNMVDWKRLTWRSIWNFIWRCDASLNKVAVIQRRILQGMLYAILIVFLWNAVFHG